MSVLTWDNVGEKEFETGISNGVLYPFDSSKATKQYGPGVAWNGITSVSESPDGAEPTDLYADNNKYLTLRSTETLGLTIEAYMYPDEFAACDGSEEISEGITVGQQTRKTFGLSYKTLIGNDTDGQDHGYKIHLIYGCTASPSDKQYETVNDSPDAMSLSWEIATNPVKVNGKKPSASVIIDSTKVPANILKKIEEALYGTTSDEAYLPTPDEILALVAQG